MPADATMVGSVRPMRPGRGRQRLRWLVLAALSLTAHAQADAELRNWFDDPFFQVSSFVANCPTPAGPFVSESERRAQTHRRAEKGTTCWLARECDRPNAYAYDQDIATALQAALRGRHPFADTTLWVTVQGRVVYVEGCAARPEQEAEIETFVRALPYVQQAMAILRVGAAARPPYRLRNTE